MSGHIAPRFAKARADARRGNDAPPRVLHVVGMLDKWAVDSWLIRMLAHARKTGRPLDWSFYCAWGLPGARDDEARGLGAGVIHPNAQLANKMAFMRELRSELISGGYDAIHSHHDVVSGFFLASTAGLSLRRVVHVHNADESVLTPSRLKQAVLRPALRAICLSMADVIVANSKHCLRKFLAGRRPQAARHRVNYYGIDQTRFEQLDVDRDGLRRELQLPADTPILLFAGRVVPEKNPVFTVDVLAALRRRLPEAVAVFAGAGDLEDAVRARAAELGQEDAVRLLGWRSDAPRIMAACDWFILPHPHEPLEGFGIAVVEAQLAGLRLLLSLGVSDEPLLPGASSARLSLDAGAEAWADAAMQLWRAAPPSRAAAMRAFNASPMQMDRALDDLLEAYQYRSGTRRPFGQLSPAAGAVAAGP